MMDGLLQSIGARVPIRGNLYTDRSWWQRPSQGATAARPGVHRGAMWTHSGFCSLTLTETLPSLDERRF